MNVWVCFFIFRWHQLCLFLARWCLTRSWELMRRTVAEGYEARRVPVALKMEAGDLCFPRFTLITETWKQVPVEEASLLPDLQWSFCVLSQWEHLSGFFGHHFVIPSNWLCYCKHRHKWSNTQLPGQSVMATVTDLCSKTDTLLIMWRGIIKSWMYKQEEEVEWNTRINPDAKTDNKHTDCCNRICLE